MAAITVPVPAAHQRAIDAQSHALLQQLLNATPAQISAYLATNSTTVPQANAIIQALAVGLRYLYRKQG